MNKVEPSKYDKTQYHPEPGRLCCNLFFELILNPSIGKRVTFSLSLHKREGGKGVELS